MTLAELFGDQPQKKNVTEALVEKQLAKFATNRLVKIIKPKKGL